MDYSKQKKYTTLLNVATPGGMWAKMTDIMVNEEDKAYLIDMRKKYKNILRNLWNPFDREREGVLDVIQLIGFILRQPEMYWSVHMCILK